MGSMRNYKNSRSTLKTFPDLFGIERSQPSLSHARCNSDQCPTITRFADLQQGSESFYLPRSRIEWAFRSSIRSASKFTDRKDFDFSA